jgi:AraC-like DNA-binding protein
VAMIAGKLGFSSSSNFSFAFRRAMGIAPGEFRANIAKSSVAVRRGTSQ